LISGFPFTVLLVGKKTCIHPDWLHCEESAFKKLCPAASQKKTPALLKALLNAAFAEACTGIKASVINANTMKIKVLFIMLTKIFLFWGQH